jgi:hypothetical protein
MPKTYFIVDLAPLNPSGGTALIKDIFPDPNFNLSDLTTLNQDYLKNLYVERIAHSGAIPWEGNVWSKS